MAVVIIVIIIIIIIHRQGRELKQKYNTSTELLNQMILVLDFQSCKMSQIWQIYLCKNIKKLGKKFVGIQNR